MYHLEIEAYELDINKILKSGQVFRYEIIDSSSAVLINGDQFVQLDYVDDGYMFHCSKEVFEESWRDYLDLDRNYKEVNEEILKVDARLEEVIKDFQGIRILRQDSFEMLFTFIVSQSKSIPQIRKLLNQMADLYGRELGVVKGKVIRGFPTAEDLKDLSDKDYRELKFGYRGPYLEDAVKKSLVYSEEAIDFVNLDDDLLKEKLVDITGVGNKVAACVMLYGYARHRSFPIDVWMKRIMLHLYEKKIRKGLKNPKVKNVSDKAIENYGQKLFGENAGIAQQYLFEYGRQILA